MNDEVGIGGVVVRGCENRTKVNVGGKPDDFVLRTARGLTSAQTGINGFQGDAAGQGPDKYIIGLFSFLFCFFC